MKIIKQGILPSKIRRFTCGNCGCIFEAEENEYERITNQMEYMETKASYKCTCPTCNMRAFNYDR